MPVRDCCHIGKPAPTIVSSPLNPLRLPCTTRRVQLSKPSAAQLRSGGNNSCCIVTQGYGLSTEFSQVLSNLPSTRPYTRESRSHVLLPAVCLYTIVIKSLLTFLLCKDIHSELNIKRFGFGAQDCCSNPKIFVLWAILSKLLPRKHAIGLQGDLAEPIVSEFRTTLKPRARTNSRRRGP